MAGYMVHKNSWSALAYTRCHPDICGPERQ